MIIESNGREVSELHRTPMAIMASGSGTTAEAFIVATQDGRADLDVGLVISNSADAGVFERIENLNRVFGLDIESAYISKEHYPVRKGEGWTRGQSLAESEAICRLLEKRAIDLVGLMGYMLIIRGDLLQKDLVNTHPGPLPETADTHGPQASQKVLDLSLPASAHTVHLVDEGVDSGLILCATPVPVRPEDDAAALFERVQIVEKAVLPLVIDKYARGRIAYGHS